jgi:hypothetical protein
VLAASREREIRTILPRMRIDGDEVYLEGS